MSESDGAREGRDESAESDGAREGRDEPAESDGAREGRDEPAAPGGDGHGELLSELASHDLALPADLAESVDAAVFEVDPDADPDETFPQSVASGGPTPEGVILWTRVAPARFDPGRPLAVEVARDPDFADLVYRGVVEDETAITAHDYTVKVDLDGALVPDTAYHYRFVYDGVASRTGRCRTLPAPDASPERVRFAVVVCQNYLNGYYGAFHHVAEEDVDFILHLGDFIYESDAGHFKGLGSREYPGREKDLPSGAERVQGLADYRYLHRTYRSDRFLQEALEAHTLLAGWDDHEMADNLYWDPETDAPAADHPRGGDPEFMTHLVADAMHAWWEYVPARVEYDPAGDRLQDRFRLWRSFQFGDLVNLLMTDERLFRAPPRTGLPTRRAVDPANEPEDRTMLGEAQREWFVNQVQRSAATWTVWADEVLTVPLRVGIGRFSLFPVQVGWDGYTRERRRLHEVVADAHLDNFVTITGDMHSYIAAYKQRRYGDVLPAGLGDAAGERIGVEFMTPAVTSLNVAEALNVHEGLRARLAEPLLSWLVTAMNPHIEHFNSHHWGYSVVEFTREDCTYVGYAVDKTEDSPDAEKGVLVTFRVPEGETELHNVTDEYS